MRLLSYCYYYYYRRYIFEKIRTPLIKTGYDILYSQRRYIARVVTFGFSLCIFAGFLFFILTIFIRTLYRNEKNPTHYSFDNRTFFFFRHNNLLIDSNIVLYPVRSVWLKLMIAVYFVVIFIKRKTQCYCDTPEFTPIPRMK